MTVVRHALVQRVLPTPWRRALGAGVVIGAAALLPGCGGGDQVKNFEPRKLVAFGDEASVLSSLDLGALGGTGVLKGLKYTVNNMVAVLDPTDSDNVPVNASFSSVGWAAAYIPAQPLPVGTVSADDVTFSTVRREFTGTFSYTVPNNSTPVTVNSLAYNYIYDCGEYRLWVQLVANGYGLGFGGAGCPLEGKSGAVSYAAAGATVADVRAQFESHRAELNSDTLVTVMAGQNDILAEYAAIKNTSAQYEAAKARMVDKGKALAAVVNDIAATGARVLIVTLPDFARSPYGRAEGGPDSTQGKLLSDLVASFNNGLVGSGGVINDGHKIGLVKFADESKRIFNDPSDYSFGNVNDPVCDPVASRNPATGAPVNPVAAEPLFGGDSLRFCTNYTIVGDPYIYFWADKVHMSPGAHARLGDLAYARAKDNPF